MTRSDEEMLQVLVSDEANFQLCGLVNSQNMRRYAKMKSSNREEEGRPENFAVETPTYQQKRMVFAGMRWDGTFGLTVFCNKSMMGPRYHRLLQHPVPKRGCIKLLPFLRPTFVPSVIFISDF